MIEIKTDKILQLEELELMNYLRKDMITETLKEFSLTQILPKRPKVKLTPFAVPNVSEVEEFVKRESSGVEEETKQRSVSVATKAASKASDNFSWIMPG